MVKTTGSSYFELERDLARYRRTNAITLIIFLLELAIIVFGLQVVVVPELLDDRRLQELLAETRAEDGVFETPVPAPPASVLGIDPVALPRSSRYRQPPAGYALANAYGCRNDYPG